MPRMKVQPMIWNSQKLLATIGSNSRTNPKIHQGAGMRSDHIRWSTGLAKRGA